MQKRIKMGEGRIEIMNGTQDGVPVLILAPLDKPHGIGEKIRKTGDEIPNAELDRRNAVVIEFPNYAGVDVFLFELINMWQDSKEAEWDKKS